MFFPFSYPSLALEGLYFKGNRENDFLAPYSYCSFAVLFALPFHIVLSHCFFVLLFSPLFFTTLSHCSYRKKIFEEFCQFFKIRLGRFDRLS